MEGQKAGRPLLRKFRRESRGLQSRGGARAWPRHLRAVCLWALCSLPLSLRLASLPWTRGRPGPFRRCPGSGTRRRERKWGSERPVQLGDSGSAARPQGGRSPEGEGGRGKGGLRRQGEGGRGGEKRGRGAGDRGREGPEKREARVGKRSPRDGERRTPAPGGGRHPQGTGRGGGWGATRERKGGRSRGQRGKEGGQRPGRRPNPERGAGKSPGVLRRKGGSWRGGEQAGKGGSGGGRRPRAESRRVNRAGSETPGGGRAGEEGRMPRRRRGRVGG